MMIRFVVGFSACEEVLPFAVCSIVCVEDAQSLRDGIITFQCLMGNKQTNKQRDRDRDRAGREGGRRSSQCLSLMPLFHERLQPMFPPLAKSFDIFSPEGGFGYVQNFLKVFLRAGGPLLIMKKYFLIEFTNLGGLFVQTCRNSCRSVLFFTCLSSV